MDDQSEKQELDAKELEIWNEGRRELKVFSDDGRETVVVKKCGLGQMDKLQAAQADDVKTALLYIVGKDPESDEDRTWFLQLEPDSQMNILEYGDQVNGPFLDKWWKRRKTKLGNMGIDVDAEMKEAMDAAKENVRVSAIDALIEEIPFPSGELSPISSPKA